MIETVAYKTYFSKNGDYPNVTNFNFFFFAVFHDFLKNITEKPENDLPKVRRQ